jgi:squalene-hopene/tetraprenyl-beta-curcumene cyclase
MEKGMAMTRIASVVACVLIAGAVALSAQQPAAKAVSGGLSAETRQKLMDSLNKAESYLRQQQQPDGRWENHPGITALVVTALLRQPGKTKAAQMPVVTKALDSLVALAKPDGGIYENQIPHYITAVSVTALAAAGRPQDKPVIDKARGYLVENMLDEGEGVAKSDFWYGGMGYGKTTRADGRRADIISLEYTLQALKDAELPANNEAWQKALTFLQRTQNNSEVNDQKWSANDGGFVYYPGFSYHEDGGTKSYGSVTYTGLMSYSWANVKKDDPRAKAALKWIAENYTVDENPGTGQKTVYYYYMVFAKALAAMGSNTITDSHGRSHNWREDLGRKLLALQHPEGYWVNDKDKAEMQDNKVLVTAFTMAAVQNVLR